MLTNCTIARPLLALAAAFVAAPLAADTPLIVSGQPQPVYQERVSYRDLDLNNWDAQRALRRRVHNASERVCIEAYGPFAATDYVPQGYRNAGMTCAGLTYDQTRPQIAAAIRIAKSGQPQVATALIVAVPATAR